MCRYCWAGLLRHPGGRHRHAKRTLQAYRSVRHILVVEVITKYCLRLKARFFITGNGTFQMITFSKKLFPFQNRAVISDPASNFDRDPHDYLIVFDILYFLFSSVWWFHHVPRSSVPPGAGNKTALPGASTEGGSAQMYPYRLPYQLPFRLKIAR